MTSESLAENCTSTNSRDVISHAKLVDEIAAKKLAINVRKNVGLPKLKQYRLMIRHFRIQIDVYALEVRCQRIANKQKIASNRHQPVTTIMQAKRWRVRLIRVQHCPRVVQLTRLILW